MTGQTGSNSIYAVDLSGGGLTTTSGSFIFNSPTAFFGPAVCQSVSSGAVRFDNFTFTSAAVPEPGSAGLALLAGMAAIIRRRRC
jgi:hypothetical protein